MDKQLIEYQWFNDYSERQIGINALGRWFYPSRRPVRSCKNCQFLNIKYLNDGSVYRYCDLNVDVCSATNCPMTICFPCNSTRSAGRGDEIQGNALRIAIYELCRAEITPGSPVHTLEDTGEQIR